jgi:hypothetical protein
MSSRLSSVEYIDLGYWIAPFGALMGVNFVSDERLAKLTRLSQIAKETDEADREFVLMVDEDGSRVARKTHPSRETVKDGPPVHYS